MKDQETLRAAAVILYGMAESLTAIADMDDITSTSSAAILGEVTTIPGEQTASEVTTPPSNVVDINTASGVEVDNHGKGVPWDGRIHTSTKKKTQKDIWKRRPGIDNEDFDLIMQELKATMAANPTPPQAGSLNGEVPPPPSAQTAPPPPPPAEKVKTMTEKAGAATYETFIAQGWTDETLVAEGYMTITQAPPPPANTGAVL